MRRLGRIDDGDLVQECGAGLLPLSVAADAITLTGGVASLSEPLEADQFLSAVGLEAADLAGSAVRWAGCGLEFAFLHVHESSLTRCAPDLAQLARLGNGGVSVFAPDGDRMHVRVFAGGVGVPEDPATGSAALRLGVFLAGSGLLPADGAASYVVEQGIEMGRPSRLECAIAVEGGNVTSAKVSGAVVPIAEGRITVPGGD
jgi:trans-2,3-dihydro-3-hydroxyanthranilate isomerase